MTGILVTKFKMGQIDVEDLADMAADESRGEEYGCEKGAGGGNGHPQIFPTGKRPAKGRITAMARSEMLPKNPIIVISFTLSISSIMALGVRRE